LIPHPVVPLHSKSLPFPCNPSQLLLTEKTLSFLYQRRLYLSIRQDGRFEVEEGRNQTLASD
jgi:hypothetical protein